MTVRGGTLHGVRTGGTVAFRGVPYARPPVGALRWKAPRPAPTWRGVRDAAASRPACWQPGLPAAQVSEDCLYVDVTMPIGHRDRRRPVLVWLPGGGNTQGSSAQYRAERMASRGDVVVVSVNYRLGVFGFFGHPGLPGSGTFGLQDQQAALRWVHRNAGSFGGDPGNVTLFGESAGAIDSCAQLTSPAAAGLFERVILQSGSCGSQVGMVTFGQPTPPPTVRSYFRPLDEVLSAGTTAESTVDCSPGAGALPCLRQVTPARLLTLTAQFGFPAYGTPTLPIQPARAVAAGAFHRMPTLTGVTRDEFRLLAALAEYSDGHIDHDRYLDMLNTAFGPDAPAVYRRYPDSAYDSPGEAWASLDTDRDMICPNLSDARRMASGTKVYSYEFADRGAPPFSGFPPDAMPPGASHGSELAYLFDLSGRTSTLTSEQIALSDTMIDYWTGFARTGDPHAPHAPRWAPLRPARSDAQTLAPGPHGIGPVAIGQQHQCDFWDHLDRPTGPR